MVILTCKCDGLRMGGLDEGISLSLGSQRAVMYKACVDIV